MKTYSISNIWIFEWPEFKNPDFPDRTDSFAVAEIQECEATLDLLPGSRPVLRKPENLFYARFVGTIYNIGEFKKGGSFYLGKTLKEARDKIYQIESEDRKKK
jgi:hypothetical protein